MYTTEIKIGNKIVPIKFGAYVMKLIADNGIRLSELSEKIQDNPADIIPKLIYYGAINASPERKGEDISLNDIYDWLDESDGGLFGEEAQSILELFTKQMSEGVLKNVKAVQPKKKAPQKTT